MNIYKIDLTYRKVPVVYLKELIFSDKYHECIFVCFVKVGRAWHVDVARYIVEHGANLNQADNYGRTPLHVAAAVDYAEMVNFLIENGGGYNTHHHLVVCVFLG